MQPKLFPRKIAEHIRAGGSVDQETACALAGFADQQTLWATANELRSHFMGNRFHLCSIINARSGNCTENCRFCSQSVHYQTGAAMYRIVNREEAIKIAQDNEAHGVHRLSLVTSGRFVDKEIWKELAELYAEISEQTNMELCASMGFLDQERAEQLAEAGITRYHCNLETNKQRFSEVCSSHSWQDKVATLTTAAEAGMSVCSGGIIGMGETMEDRIKLALELRELGVQSIPLNILTPIPGTPFAELEPLSVEEVLSTIALFRFINPDAVIRIAGGRQQLGAEQYRCFSSGANGAIVGNYLTTIGSSIAKDIEVLKKMGFTL